MRKAVATSARPAATTAIARQRWQPLLPPPHAQLKRQQLHVPLSPNPPRLHLHRRAMLALAVAGTPSRRAVGRTTGVAHEECQSIAINPAPAITLRMLNEFGCEVPNANRAT